jgi:glycosyltransferase involved in cell wall biosynthesis
VEEPLVTVALQFYNNESTLPSAIRSILYQSFPKWELVLQDDGSTDCSMEIARQYRDGRIRLFSDGLRKRRPTRINESLEVARGKYFALMDGDDISYPDRLLKQVRYLENNPDVDLVGAHVLVFDNTGRPVGKRVCPEMHEDICRKPWSGFPMAQPTFLGHIRWFRLHGYDEKIDRSEDQDLLLRSYRSSQFANVPEILLGYREGTIHLKKILTGRWFFAQALAREFRQQEQPGLAVRAVLEQAMKAIVDCVAFISGLNYRLLRHRAQPITDTERREWEHVWQLVHRTEVKSCAASTAN